MMCSCPDCIRGRQSLDGGRLAWRCTTCDGHGYVYVCPECGNIADEAGEYGRCRDCIEASGEEAEDEAAGE